MISVKCPNCGKAHPAEKEVVGKKVRCEDCGFAFVARQEKLDKITIRCPRCGTEHQAPQAVEGKRIRCNDCGHQFVASDQEDQPLAGAGPPPITPAGESPFPDEPYAYWPDTPKAPPEGTNVFLGHEEAFSFALMPGEEVIEALTLIHTVLFIFPRGVTRVTLTNRRILYNAAKVFSPLYWILLALFHPLIFYYVFRIPANRSVSIPLMQIDSVEKKYGPNWLVFVLSLFVIGALSFLARLLALWSAVRWELLVYLPVFVTVFFWLVSGPLVLLLLLATRIVRIDVRSHNNHFAVTIGTMAQGASDQRCDRFIRKISSEIQRAKTSPEPESAPT
jgi:DNA-directed RNA polymerase subunit RPC12/RpoP